MRGMDSASGKPLKVTEAREAWLRSRHPHDRDFAAEDDDLRDAFAAGWNAARPTIYGTGQASPSHNAAKRPGELQVTVWGHTEEGQSVALVFTEDGAVALRDNLTRMGVGL